MQTINILHRYLAEICIIIAHLIICSHHLLTYKGNTRRQLVIERISLCWTKCSGFILWRKAVKPRVNFLCCHFLDYPLRLWVSQVGTCGIRIWKLYWLFHLVICRGFRGFKWMSNVESLGLLAEILISILESFQSPRSASFYPDERDWMFKRM